MLCKYLVFESKWPECFETIVELLSGQNVIEKLLQYKFMEMLKNSSDGSKKELINKYG